MLGRLWKYPITIILVRHELKLQVEYGSRYVFHLNCSATLRLQDQLHQLLLTYSLPNISSPSNVLSCS